MRTGLPVSVYVYGEGASGGDLRALLERVGYEVGGHDLRSLNGVDLGRQAVIVVDGAAGPGRALTLCRQLRQQMGEHFVPILYVTDDVSPAARLACLEHGADAYLLRPFDPAELAAQVQTFARIKDRHDRLTEKTAEIHRINKRLQTAYQQIDQELQLAGRIQESFLPHTLPRLPQTRFAVHYRPCGRVGGDFYDVFRLDERHFGVYVADAMGHGIPASLLTIFVKKGIRPKEISGHDYRLVPPNEVLERLNRDLIDQALSDQPFITMVYGLFNYAEGTFQFARSGHPYPLYVPHDGPPELWRVEGTLLGVFDTTYPLQTQPLRPGDKLLLYTDGVDGGNHAEQSRGAASLLACAEQHRRLPVEEFVQALAGDLFAGQKPADDLTLLALERLGQQG